MATEFLFLHRIDLNFLFGYCRCSKGAVCWNTKYPMWGLIRGNQCTEPCSIVRDAQKKLPLRYMVQIWLLPLSVTRADPHVVTGNDSAPWCNHTGRPLKISYINDVFLAESYYFCSFTDIDIIDNISIRLSLFWYFFNC